MKKSEKTQVSIMEFLEKNPGSSSTEIAQSLDMTYVGIYYNLKILLKKQFVSKKWNRNATRYFKNNDTETPTGNTIFYKEAHNTLMNEYEWLEELSVSSLCESLLSDLSADGIWSYWLQAFKKKMTKENNNILPSKEKLQERFVDFLSIYIEEEGKRTKNTLFSGTQSLKKVLSRNDMPVSLDKLYFSQVTNLLNFPSVWRLRCADEIYWGKKLQNERLLKSGISLGVENIIHYLRKNKTKTVVFTPPTIKRVSQFPNILRSILSKRAFVFDEIIAKKRSSLELNFKPQKETKGKDRIINARASIIVEDISKFLSVPEIVIFDDNFTTWATVNAIAEKMRAQWYTWKIVALTLTGNFDYIPWVTDIGDI